MSAEFVEGHNVFRLWDATTGVERANFRHDAWVLNCVLSPDGKELALKEGLGSAAVVFMRVSDGKELRRIDNHPASMCNLSYSPDGRTLAGTNEDGRVQLRAASDGKDLPPTCTDKVEPKAPLAFSPDGKALAVASGIDWLRMVDLVTGREQWRRKTGLTGYPDYATVAFLPDGKALLWGGEDRRSFALYDAATGGVLRSFRVTKGTTRPVALSPDGRWVASIDEVREARPCYGLWDVATGVRVRTLNGPADSDLPTPAFSPDGKRLAAASGDGVIHV